MFVKIRWFCCELNRMTWQSFDCFPQEHFLINTIIELMKLGVPFDAFTKSQSTGRHYIAVMSTIEIQLDVKYNRNTKTTSLFYSASVWLINLFLSTILVKKWHKKNYFELICSNSADNVLFKVVQWYFLHVHCIFLNILSVDYNKYSLFFVTPNYIHTTSTLRVILMEHFGCLL